MSLRRLSGCNLLKHNTALLSGYKHGGLTPVVHHAVKVKRFVGYKHMALKCVALGKLCVFRFDYNEMAIAEMLDKQFSSGMPRQSQSLAGGHLFCRHLVAKHKSALLLAFAVFLREVFEIAKPEESRQYVKRVTARLYTFFIVTSETA